ncbi:hypothetical protein MPSEU_000718000 [Mayamaea pseudoterrestris]|nr:hypothetical protein MPSEU_000718000 [Mayamaea pseudoterrestris]
MGAALLRCNFLYGDLLRWLGGEYTHQYQDRSELKATIDSLRTVTIPPRYPPVDFDTALHILSEGVPMKSVFECPFADVARREHENNRGLEEDWDNIMEKYRKEEKLSYHIMFPRFLWAYVPGLFLALISYIPPKPGRLGDEGRLINDPSTPLHPDDKGNVNKQIPKWFMPEHDPRQNPKVHYGSVLNRLVQLLWNLRLDHPKEEIYIAADDISAVRWYTTIRILPWHYLGLDWDSRTMEVSLPILKQQKLAHMLDQIHDDWTARSKPRSVIVSAQDKTTILGLIRHGGSIADLADYLSIRLQQSLTDQARKADAKLKHSLRHATKPEQYAALRKWWKTSRLALSEGAFADLQILRGTLDNPEWAHIWRKPIGLMVEREPTNTVKGDASTKGLGGFNEGLLFMWRLSDKDLSSCGFKTRNVQARPTRGPITDDDYHINVLEFVAIIINVILTIGVYKSCPIRCHELHILNVLGDNTSALSWMRHAARCTKPHVRRLARFFHAIATYSTLSLRIQANHIPGKDNVEADRLSRFTPSTLSWASVISPETQVLANCKVFLVESKLLTVISSVINNTANEETFGPTTIARLTSAPRILENGVLKQDSTTSLSRQSHRGKKSRS